MDIERVDGCGDPRFSREVLCQHGAFLVDGEPWAFRVVSDRAAVIAAERLSEEALREAVVAFRFYAEHITEFYDEGGRRLMRLPPVERWEVPIERLQPSQFSVDRDKCAAVGTFLRGPADLVIPVLRMEDALVILDGHTRLYTAWQRGIRTAMVFRSAQEQELRESLAGFVREARRRNIRQISEMALLSPREQEEQWHGWCRAYFAGQTEKE